MLASSRYRAVRRNFNVLSGHLIVSAVHTSPLWEALTESTAHWPGHGDLGVPHGVAGAVQVAYAGRSFDALASALGYSPRPFACLRACHATRSSLNVQAGWGDMVLFSNYSLVYWRHMRLVGTVGTVDWHMCSITSL